MKKRCFWVNNDPLYIEYHDTEWGKPVYDDETLFEFLLLESFQAGLSWITILKKRENFREAFDNFDYKKIAKYNQDKFDELILNAGIIRNKLKVKSAITNAQLFMEIQKEFGSFSTFIWNYVDGKPILNTFKTREEVPATTTLSDVISKDLKKRGFKFVGSTIIYAFMQAIGMVNDHTTDCFCYEKCV
ncbi:DNA-3-methyladenine glycosylase I [Lutibacter sp. Hel_I_33_5]|uniref:DNA-3-methyladenine glycosylase I n=1 Tax=Lutibacter sp. Hel_I_33_5 TaxID=1566289 RepID=UPI0011AAECE6|nr:DNA-3-methyladenine glycosylase I [Lutibacter sp. Hel_I_33_5]TVZ55886.1 DNA-3-methyladenine glycosylase I [Lutibacter sp. Hel_I_33_5]